MWFGPTFLGLALLALHLNQAWAQDRSQSRYVASTQNEDYIPENIPPPRRTTSRRTRPNEDIPERVVPQRTRSRSDLDDSVRQIVSTLPPYTQPEPEKLPEISEDPPRRRKRPKKRRRPKADRKPEVILVQEEPKAITPVTVDDSGDYFAYREPQPIPSNEFSRDSNLRQAARTSEGDASPRNSRTSTADANERSSRHQSYHPQPATNRLPPESSEEKIRENQPLVRGIEIPPNAGYHPQPARNYATADDPTTSRLPVHDTSSEERSRDTHSPAEAEVRLPPTEHSVALYGQDGLTYDGIQRQPEFVLRNEDVRSQEDQLNIRFPVPTNRLPNEGDITYQSQHFQNPAVSMKEDEIADAVRLGSQDTNSPSDRLQPPSNRRNYQEESIYDRLPQPEGRQSQIHSSLSPSTRAGSRYQSELSDKIPVYGRTPAEEPEPLPPSRTNSRQRAQERPDNPRTTPRLQREGSRYRPDDSESVRYNPSRTPPQEVPEVDPKPQRVVTRVQRTRTRNQVDSVDQPRRSPEVSRGPTRTRTRQEPPTSPPPPPLPQNQYNYPIDVQPASEQRDELPVRAVPIRSRQQPQFTSHSEDVEEDDEEVLFQRSRPQNDGPPSRTQQADRAVILPEHIPEYQRPPPRRAEQKPPQTIPIDTDVRSRQRVPNRQPQRAPQVPSRTNNPPPRAPSRSSNEPPPRHSGGNFRCPNDYGFYAHDDQCDKYYECRNGTAEEGLCSDGLAFNPISSPTYLRCDSIRDIDCSLRPQLQEPRSTKNCPRQFGLFPDKKDCTKFWHCVDGVSTQVKCPPGLVYDDTKGTCNWADLVEESCSTEDLLGFSCPAASPAELQEGVYTRYAHPDNCQLHFTCIKGTDGQRRPRMLSCNEGFVFDPETGQCTRPENVPGCEEFYGKPEPRPARKPAKSRQPVVVEEVDDDEEGILEPILTRSQRRRPANQRS